MKSELDAVRYGTVKAFRKDGLIVIRCWFAEEPNWGWFTRSYEPKALSKHILADIVSVLDELTGVHATSKKAIIKAWKEAL